MPYRSKERLQEWVAEFQSERPGNVPGAIDVLTHDGGAGADTGLVIMRMIDLPADVYLHPVGPGDPNWQVNFGPRTRELALSASQLRGLSRELDAAASLCEFLERKSAEHDDNYRAASASAG
jgi:hypothetical protein